VSGAQLDYFTLFSVHSMTLQRQSQLSCLCMLAKCVFSCILVISVVVMLECGVCYFLSLSVQGASYKLLHMLCTGVKHVGEVCKVTRIVLLAL
jgi:hypothetical protein